MAFLSFARKYRHNYGKILMHTATKTGIDAAKTAPKIVVWKTAEAAGNKIADKITSLGKTKKVNKKKVKQIKDKKST